MMRAWALSIALAACSPHKESPVMNHSTDTTSDDARLVARVREIAAAPGALETIEQRVGTKALVNTATGFPLAGLRRANLMVDPDHPHETLALDNARDVVYWKRPVAGDDPHVVGVQVWRDGTGAVFFAIVGPP